MGAGRAGWYSWDAPGGARRWRSDVERHRARHSGRPHGILHVSRSWIRSGGIRKRFRLYSMVTVVVLLVFGMLTFFEAPRLQADLPTPWIGLWERINLSAFLLWVVVLAFVLWSRARAQGQIV